MMVTELLLHTLDINFEIQNQGHPSENFNETLEKSISTFSDRFRAF